jgi:uncharacterized delta-60 repeat protein
MPRYTVLSIVTTVMAVSIVVGEHFSPGSGFDAFGNLFIALITVALCFVLNLIWAVLSLVKGERYGGVIGIAGMFLPMAAMGGLHYVDRLLQVRADRTRTWSTIEEVLVQPDGKLLVVGTGLMRLLPDGQPDPTFHRDYSYARGGSLPDPVRTELDSPGNGCAAMMPDGDVLLANQGWIGRVHPDGSDAPDLRKRQGDEACWGMAVQPDGKILIGWDSPRKSPIVRLLPDGGIDPSFHTTLAPTPDSNRSPSYGHRRTIALLREGRIMLAGPVETVEGDCVRTLVRLNADGSIDEGFHFRESCRTPDAADQGVPNLMMPFPDGSLLVHMQNIRGIPHEAVYLDRDGKEIPWPVLREPFMSFDIGAFALANDGGVFVGRGGMMAKLRPDGTLSPAFNARDIDQDVRKIVVQGEKILIVDNREKLFRLNGDGSLDSSFKARELKVFD